MKITRTILAALAVLIALNAAAVNPKREFRGAWMHIIGQEQYAKMTTAETQTYLIDQLDKLKKAGCNAIIWQVRPQSDAAYKSDLEPWSKWITGVAGKAPVPEWDPLQFMIEESHKRGMELHAWIIWTIERLKKLRGSARFSRRNQTRTEKFKSSSLA